MNYSLNIISQNTESQIKNYLALYITQWQSFSQG